MSASGTAAKAKPTGKTALITVPVEVSSGSDKRRSELRPRVALLRLPPSRLHAAAARISRAHALTVHVRGALRRSARVAVYIAACPRSASDAALV
jgi:hypothetical protein